MQMVAGKSLLQRIDDGNTAGNGGSEEERAAVLTGKGRELRTVLGDQFLIGGDHGFSRGQGARHPVVGGLKAAHQFDDDVDVGGEDLIDIAGPAYLAGYPVHALALHIAIVDVGEA